MSGKDADGPYDLVVAPGASRAISEVIPESAAWAVIDFVNGRLLANPHRVGYRLHGRLEGLHGAHVGDYRVEYDIDDEDRRVEIVRVALRADIYGIT
ncbi:MAG: type II toxin-antitoxin system RelE family toxin [Streptosporangiaceae bacterium]